ncbi:hypothetical protein RSAG8_12509, partial [Rhizoctonia solani AG-8 WAC10335]
MATPETTLDLSQCAAGLADAAALMAEAAQHMSEAASAMCHGLQPGTNVFLHAANEGKAYLDYEPGEDNNLSNHQSDTEDGNTGNNTHRTESRVGVPESHASPPVESEQPALQGKDRPSPSPGASLLTGQDALRNALLFPGRYYIILEEEFDILPVIAAYVSICRKTLCCMPFIDASQSWRDLLSAISPSHEVLEITDESSTSSPGVAQYISSDKSSLLIQSFTSWQTHPTISSISDSLLVWGFLNVGEEQLTRIQDTILNVPHTCAIVTQKEYESFNLKAYFASLRFTEHPKSTLIKQLDVTSLLSGFRGIVQGVLHNPKFYNQVHLLYKASLEFYINSPNENIKRSKRQAARLASIFAAKILLHGPEKKGDSRFWSFKPQGVMLPVDRESIQKVGLNRTAQLGLIKEGPTQLAYNPAVPSSSTISKDNTSALKPDKSWYIVLEEDFDAIPFILNQIEKHLKTICFISYGSTAEPYKEIFSLMTHRSIIRPGHGTDSANKGLSIFNSLQSGLLLLRGAKAISSLDSIDLKADVAIYWGVPPEPHLTNTMITVQAAHTYVLISSIDDFLTRQRVTIGKSIKEYPGSMQMNSAGPKAPLHPYRDRTRQALESIPITVPKKIYNDQVGMWVKTGGNVSTRESIIRANQFAARVLLHGESYDGSALYPPVNSRPAITQKQVAKCGLQPYLDEGLMWVG